MTEISITKTIYEYFDDIGDTEIRQNIIMYMEKYNIGNTGISTKTKHKIKFKNHLRNEGDKSETRSFNGSFLIVHRSCLPILFTNLLRA